MNSNSKLLPELDERAFGRNQKTAWLLYLDRLTDWLWQDHEGAARWTLILDDAQSRLKHALVHAFAPHYPTTISLHPNTEALDASGNIVPFGTNLLRAIGIEIVPEDTDGVTRAHLELLRQIQTFPGLQHGLNPLKSWCDRILLLLQDRVLRRTPLLGVRFSQSRFSRLQDAEHGPHRLPLEAPL